MLRHRAVHLLATHPHVRDRCAARAVRTDAGKPGDAEGGQEGAGADVGDVQDPERDVQQHSRGEGVHPRGARAPPVPRRQQRILSQGAAAGEHRRVHQPGDRSAGRSVCRRRAGRWDVPGADQEHAHLGLPDERPTAQLRDAAPVLRVPRRHRRPGAEAVQRLREVARGGSRVGAHLRAVRPRADRSGQRRRPAPDRGEEGRRVPARVLRVHRDRGRPDAGQRELQREGRRDDRGRRRQRVRQNDTARAAAAGSSTPTAAPCWWTG